MYERSESVQNESETDLFMNDFKFYKRFKDFKPIEHPAVIILDQLNNTNLDHYQLKKVEPKTNFVSESKNYGLKPISDWKCFESTESPGLFLIENPFLPGYQRFFVKKCLIDYHCLPNKTNLDIHLNREGVNLWKNAIEKKDMSEFNKLRWTTIGYHYDWTNKVYNDSDFTPIPKDVSHLSVQIAASLGFTSFQPEAGIINYYHMNSTLSAHQDYSEKNMSAPLVSISFGSSALFLIGDVSKTTRGPRPILLKSGDIVVMSGPTRLAFHAVPKILPNPHLHEVFTYTKADLDESQYYVGDDEWADLYDYIRINQINLNIRQVN